MYKVIPILSIIILCSFLKSTASPCCVCSESASAHSHIFLFVLMFSGDLGVSLLQMPLLAKHTLLVEF